MVNSDIHLVQGLLRTEHLMRSVMEQHLRKFNLTISEFTVIQTIIHFGPMPIQNLGKIILLTSGTMTHVVNRMIEKGYLVRTQSEEDKRVYYVNVTEKAFSFHQETEKEHVQFIDGVLGNMKSDEKTQLLQLLNTLFEHITDYVVVEEKTKGTI